MWNFKWTRIWLHRQTPTPDSGHWLSWRVTLFGFLVYAKHEYQVVKAEFLPPDQNHFRPSPVQKYPDLKEAVTSELLYKAEIY